MTEPLILDVRAFERALRNVLSDEELTKRFWARGYEELTSHAGNNASQWLGKRILTAAVVAIEAATTVAEVEAVEWPA